MAVHSNCWPLIPYLYYPWTRYTKCLMKLQNCLTVLNLFLSHNIYCRLITSVFIFLSVTQNRTFNSKTLNQTFPKLFWNIL